MLPDWYWCGVFFVFGLIFGSFLNVCIYRLPRGLSVVRPRSACPSCGAPIAAYDNIPVLSWLILRGRCRRCKAPITPRYAVVELVCGLLFLLSFLHAPSWEEALKGCLISFLFLGLLFTDAETHLLPDALTLPGLAIALLMSPFVLVSGPAFQMFPLRFQGPITLTQLNLQLGLRSLVNAALGALIGAGLLYAIGWIYLHLRHVEGMGLGDVKLMAAAGAFLGPMLTLLVLCVASLLGGLYGVAILWAVFRQRRARYRARLGRQATARAWQAAQVALRGIELPFGVFLSGMTLLAWFYGIPLLQLYLRLLLPSR